MGAPTEITTLRKAAKLVGRSPETVRAWCKKYDLGQMDGHRFKIDRAKLLKVARAHTKAAAVLRGAT